MNAPALPVLDLVTLALPLPAQQPATPAQLAAPVIAGLPAPEDPVDLPTDEEVARHVAERRAAWLKYLQHDPDGWDDLWVLIQKSYDRNYQFDPGDKTKDTDRDGFSDYEEMLRCRDATRREPAYTKARQIELIREARRQAIRGAITSGEEQFRVRALFAPYMHQDVPSDVPGKSFSIEDDTVEKRQRLGQALPAMEQEEKARLRAVFFEQRLKSDCFRTVDKHYSATGYRHPHQTRTVEVVVLTGVCHRRL